MFKNITFFLFLFLLSCASFSQDNAETALILKRYKSYLLSTDTSINSFKKIPEVNEAGMWKDINYSDNQAGAWQANQHMTRIRSLAIAWSAPASPVFHSPDVKRTISIALNHWGTKRYQNKNWWHNEIGIPQIMRDVLVLMRDSLSPALLTQSLEVLAQHKVKGTGANLVWSADLGLHYGALTYNKNLMKLCRDTILSVIKITTAEGVQPDYSFHQHGKRLQMYHYGGAFLVDDVRLAWELRETSLAFPKEKIDILTDFVLNGWQWMARGINTVPGTIDRAASRSNALHSADIRKLMRFLYQLVPDSIQAFKKLYATQQGKSALNGYRYFPYSDFTAYHQPRFSFFLKTTSTRTLLTEAINQENLRGGLLNSGDGYFISDGNEYYNLMPVWDWDRLPGLTNFISNKKDKIKQQKFVGNVSDGHSGLAVMNYALQKNKKSLETHKFWATHKNITVALITPLKTTGLQEPAFTVLDQSRWRGNVTVNKPGNILGQGVHSYKHVKWIHHKNFVYIPFHADSIVLSLSTRKDTWSAINASESDRIISDKVFMPSIIHTVDKNSSGYVIGFAATPQQAARLAKNPVWKILQNDSICQAVLFTDGTLMASFYKTGEIILSPTLRITVSKPSLALLKKDLLYISDPAHIGGTIEGLVNGKPFVADLSADGTTAFIELSSTDK